MKEPRQSPPEAISFKPARKRHSKAEELEPTTPPTNIHIHRWRIEEPNGPMGHGECKNCGETREFKNSYDDLTIMEKRAEDSRAAEAKRRAKYLLDLD